MAAMSWENLFSKTRLWWKDGRVFESDTTSSSGRDPFERDGSRIIFSNAFRRLHDKTQLFPMPEDDVVHSRLTHSLEVATVGRSLARNAMLQVSEAAEWADDAANIVWAACLAHDIGNPPLGHAGEDAIAAYFRENQAALGEHLSDLQLEELKSFEGNAQGLRIISRLQHEADGGLALTAATYGALVKYPCQVKDRSELRKGDVAYKKFGVLETELEFFQAAALPLGLISRCNDSLKAWVRHPLAFLMEAADDICNALLDIEDACRLGVVSFEDARDAFWSIAKGAGGFEERRAKVVDERAALGYLRAVAIGKLSEEVAHEFATVSAVLLTGERKTTLCASIPSSEALRVLQALAKDKCYSHPHVLEIEVAGYKALGGLLELFVESATSDCSRGRDVKVREFLSRRGVVLPDGNSGQKIQRIVDFVSGMTDRHALATFRHLSGISLRGSR